MSEQLQAQWSFEHPDARRFYDILTLLERVKRDKDLVRLRLTPTGIEVSQTDEDKAEFCKLTLSKDAFIGYDCGGTFDWIVNVSTLMKWLKSSNEGESLRVTSTSTGISLSRTGGKFAPRATRHLIIPNAVTEAKFMAIKEITGLDNACRILSSYFASLLGEDPFSGEYIDISLSEDGLFLTYEGENNARAPTVIPWDNHEGFAVIKTKIGVSSKFMVERLVSTVKNLSSVFPDVLVEFGNNLPLQLKASNEYISLLYAIGNRKEIGSGPPS
jgi:hypothetical protein